MNRLLLPAVATLLLLGACASDDPKRLGEAVVSPLNDLNVVHASIPPLLLESQKQPYAVPADASCPALAEGIRALDAVLGPDIDAPPSAGNSGLVERTANSAGHLATDAVKGAAEGVVPFRGWVRKLTGAERYAKDVAAAIAAGTARRAFLKGLRAAHACV